MDIRLEHNDVAVFHIALVVLPTYSTREVILGTHLWFLNLKFRNLFVHELWLGESK